MPKIVEKNMKKIEKVRNNAFTQRTKLKDVIEHVKNKDGTGGLENLQNGGPQTIKDKGDGSQGVGAMKSQSLQEMQIDRDGKHWVDGLFKNKRKIQVEDVLCSLFSKAIQTIFT